MTTEYQSPDPGHHLKCHHCDGDEFVRSYKLRVMSKGGTGDEPSALYCMTCKQPVNQNEMQKAFRLSEKKWQIMQMMEGGTT